MGHKTSQCGLLRDLVQKALNEGRLKFGDKAKPQMQVDVDPMKVVDEMYVEVANCNVVEAMIGVVKNLFVEANVGINDCQVVEALEGPKVSNEVISESEISKKMKVAYSMAEEELIDFLNRCILRNSEVMMCTRCSDVWIRKMYQFVYQIIK